MATKIENPIIRRVAGSTPLYEIVELSIFPATVNAPEILGTAVRNPRKQPEFASVPLIEALATLFPAFWGEEQTTKGATPAGMVSAKSLEDAIMIHGEFTQQERAKFFNLVREVQTGER